MSARVAVVGAGAIGMTIGGTLAAAGYEVLACARRAPQRPAIVVERAGAPAAEHPVRWCTDPAEPLPAVDWLVVATKIQDTASARPWLDALAGDGTMVVAAQNGVDHVERLAALTPAPVVPALVYYNSERLEVGRVRVRPTERDLVFPDTAPGRAAAAFMSDGGVRSVVDPDFTTASWLKLLTNAVANPITALTGRRVEVLNEASVAGLARDVLREAAQVARAEGARLADDVVEERLGWLQGLQAGSTTSMLQDREAGRPLEAGGLTGAIVRAGARHGVPTPVNSTLLALLAGLGVEAVLGS